MMMMIDACLQTGKIITELLKNLIIPVSDEMVYKTDIQVPYFHHQVIRYTCSFCAETVEKC